MTCEEYRKAFATFTNTRPVNNRYSDEQMEWNRHRLECSSCTEWDRAQRCQRNGITPSNHCCLDMAYNISRPIEVPHQGPNRVLDWYAPWDEYMIPVAYDGYSATIIAYCPWCGRKLPESKRNSWYETLRSMGYDDPGEQDIPNEYHSDAWWRKRAP